MTPTAWVLRAVLLLLPCAALALALPERPHPLVIAVVVLCSAWWAWSPDHLAGMVTLATVIAWWTVHDVVDWRILVVSVLLVGAHLLATVLSYGPDVMAVDRHLAVVWVRRGLLTLVPLPITWVALRGLDADQAPSWVWIAAALTVVVMVVATLRLTQPVDE
ncbi:hypothetical protein SAMN05192575_103403 [Nocardioides alpinus]|uniref:MYXO-CTERM domain-containing protein n=1 Tax=Nocardioides alpinus TaxID=748909 RepID=A0A1I0YCV4_9ACTN|nr:hypothetical protein [Nocardioides alpinus]PKH38926.1 hypothetical protein CXG46_14390 [Nocardioides alpinus]SFB10606.1 hypothetical protein SAMN05192575_103403 [Nocardioides alpinus]